MWAIPLGTVCVLFFGFHKKLGELLKSSIFISRISVSFFLFWSSDTKMQQPFVQNTKLRQHLAFLQVGPSEICFFPKFPFFYIFMTCHSSCLCFSHRLLCCCCCFFYTCLVVRKLFTSVTSFVILFFAEFAGVLGVGLDAWIVWGWSGVVGSRKSSQFHDIPSLTAHSVVLGRFPDSIGDSMIVVFTGLHQSCCCSEEYLGAQDRKMVFWTLQHRRNLNATRWIVHGLS